jgi:hypothetical protein
MSIPCGLKLIEETALITKIRDITLACGCKITYYAPDRVFYHQLSDVQVCVAQTMGAPVTKKVTIKCQNH